MKRYLAALVLVALVACDGGRTLRPLPAGSATASSSWEVGPIIDGKTRSVGVPLRPRAHPDGLAIDIPYPTPAAGHVHYVTFNPGPLAGKSRLVLRYRIEAADGVRIIPSSPPGLDERSPALLTLFFQRCGDDWSAVGRYESYRWWASFATQAWLTPGDGEVVAPLDGPWSAVMNSTRDTYRKGFDEALANTCRVGFTLGGGDGLGHGVYATGPARFIIREFRVE